MGHEGWWRQIYRKHPNSIDRSLGCFTDRSALVPRQAIVRLVEILRKQVGGSGESETIFEDSKGWDYHWDWDYRAELVVELDFEEIRELINQNPELKSMMTLHQMKGECDARA